MNERKELINKLNCSDKVELDAEELEETLTTSEADTKLRRRFNGRLTTLN